MSQSVKQSKLPPKKYQPKGVSILYEDPFLLVVHKRSGLLTVGNEKTSEKTAQFLLDSYVKKGNSKSKNRVFIVHRLDKDTSGILIFAKTPEIKKELQENWSTFTKTYSAVIEGKPLKEKKGVLRSYLTENSIHKVYSTDNKTIGKLAETEYTVVEESPFFSLLEIVLLTGRKNQIRVQFADIKHPVAGDKKYGNGKSKSRRLALHSQKITFIHPISKEKLCFETPIPIEFYQLIK